MRNIPKLKEKKGLEDLPASLDGLVPDEALNLYRFPRTVYLLWKHPGKLASLMEEKKWDKIVSPITFYTICITLSGVTYNIATIMSRRSLTLPDSSLWMDIRNLLFLLLAGVPFIIAYHLCIRLLQRLVDKPPLELRTTISSWCYLGGVFQFFLLSIVGTMLYIDKAFHGPVAHWAGTIFMVGSIVLSLRLLVPIHTDFLDESIGFEGPIATIPAFLLYGGFLLLFDKVLGV